MFFEIPTNEVSSFFFILPQQYFMLKNKNKINPIIINLVDHKCYY